MVTALQKLPTKVLCKLGQGPRLLRRNSGGPVILLYHGVTAERSGRTNLDGKHVHVDLFRAQLRLLAQRRRVVALEELIEAVRTGADARGMVAITFDDGYLNNVELAAPILRELGLPASFFIATGFIDSKRWPWVDRVEAAVSLAGSGPHRVSILGDRVTITDAAQRMDLIVKVKRQLKRLSWEQAEQRTEELERDLSVKVPEPYGDYRFMDWDQVRNLDSGGFEIGAHTVNHALLSRVSIETAKREIIDSRERIHSELGHCSRTFCYPNGKRADYNDEVKAFCSQHFAAALSTERGTARGDELFELRRLVLDDATTCERLASAVVQA